MSALERAVEKAGGQEQLANGIGVTQGRISQWLSGDPIPNKHFPGIERLTGVTAHELLDDELAKLKASSRRRQPISKTG
jgi:DNA-binding transcriptional regulator YdaS (Cro superfamily)